jgi:sigma-E factor negative regulatory protein RseC
MIEEIGTITALDNDHIWVETQIKTTCQSCAVNDDCGTGAVAKAFSPKTEQLILRCHDAARVGQKVKLGIPEQHLLNASALVYLLPLVALIGSAVLGQWVLPILNLQGELWLVLFTLVITTLCFLGIKKHIKADKSDRYQPILLALIPFHENTIQIQHISEN